jgi:hypothetical protein
MPYDVAEANAENPNPIKSESARAEIESTFKVDSSPLKKIATNG